MRVGWCRVSEGFAEGAAALTRGKSPLLSLGESPLPALSSCALASCPSAAAAAQERLLQRGPRVPGRRAASVAELHAGEGRQAGGIEPRASSGSLLSRPSRLQPVQTCTGCVTAGAHYPLNQFNPLPSTQYNGPDNQVTRDAAVTRRQFEQVGGRPGHKTTCNGPLSPSLG